MMDALFSQEEVDKLREYHAEKKGEAKSFWKLVRDEIIPKAIAAKELGISIAQFDKLCKEYAFA